jgi:4-hydroxy-4-methyl-2-oxoglutarate aldolase
MEPNVKNLLEAGTAVIADIFNSQGILPPVLDNHLFPVTGPGTRFGGPGYTIAGAFQEWSGGFDRAKLEAIDEMPAGVVAVWAGADMHGVCCFGDLLAEAMKARGCAGVVVDGGIRDLVYLRTLNLPMMARYCTPAGSKGRWQVVHCQVPVRVRGALQEWIVIHPGDVIVADDDGAMVVPKDLVESVSSRAQQWSQEDTQAREDIRRGMKLLEAMEKYGHL